MKKICLMLGVLAFFTPVLRARENTNHGTNAGNAGSGNTSIGYYAGDKVTANENVFVGWKSGFINNQGFYNTFIGSQSGFYNSRGAYNTFNGYRSGYYNTTSNDNSFYGGFSGEENKGNSNTFIGSYAGRYNKDGSYNIFIGKASGYKSDSSFSNLYIGNYSGQNCSDGHQNVFIGDWTGYTIEQHSYENCIIGHRAGYSLHRAEKNVFLGKEAGFSLLFGTNNILIGHHAGYDLQYGEHNVVIGNGAGEGSIIRDMQHNVLIGDQAGHTSDGRSNVFIGSKSGAGNSGFSVANVFVGAGSGKANSGSENVYVGSASGSNNEEGWYNTYVGYGSGGNSQGGKNVFIGYNAGDTVQASNQLYIDNKDEGVPLIFGDFVSQNIGLGTVTPGSYRLYVNGDAYAMGNWMGSDKRFKENELPITDAISVVQQLQGLSYNYVKSDKFKNKHFHDQRSYGFFAQDIQQVIPELVREDAEGYLAVNYDGLIPFLVEAVKELDEKHSKEINNLNQEIESLKNLLNTKNTALKTSVDESVISLQNNSVLFQNSPNPFNTVTTIKYRISEDNSEAFITIYDLQGKQIMKITDVHSGEGKITIPAEALQPGIYHYGLIVNNKLIDMKKMVVTD